MGKAYVTATISRAEPGEPGREYRFLVDTGATHMGLPVDEIERVGLTKARGKMRFITAIGPQEFDTYLGWVSLDGEGATVTVIPQPMPVIGYEVLENLRYKVNPVTRRLEKIPENENGGPVALVSPLR